MARFQFSLSSFAGRPPSAAVISQRTLRALRLCDAREPQEAPQGPGWFESSWELTHGLDVREGLPGDARLHEWLDVCLRTQAVSAVDAAHFDEFGIVGLELV